MDGTPHLLPMLQGWGGAAVPDVPRESPVPGAPLLSLCPFCLGSLLRNGRIVRSLGSPRVLAEDSRLDVCSYPKKRAERAA